MKTDELRARLLECGAPTFGAALPEQVLRAILKDREHPLRSLFARGSGDRVIQSTRLLEDAAVRILEWLTSSGGRGDSGWWAHKLRLLAGRSAAATLAEIRAMGVLLSTDATPTGGLGVFPIPENRSKSPDFRVSAGSSDAYVEVCCPDLAADARRLAEARKEITTHLSDLGTEDALRRLQSSEASRVSLRCSAAKDVIVAGVPKRVRQAVDVVALRRDDGTTASFTLSHAMEPPYGVAKKEGAIHTIASCLAGKKGPEQIPKGAPGILWMDLCDGPWAMSVADCAPASRFWLGLALASTFGIWHSFYGRREITMMFERAPVGFAMGDHASVTRQLFDGRFRIEDGRRWSAAVLLCSDGLVLYEHPMPEVPLPFDVVRELVALQLFDVHRSFHRFAEDDFDGLQRRLDDVERQLEFYAS